MGSWEISSDGGSTFTNLATLHFDVKSAMGTGMLPVKNLSTPLAQQPGEEYQGTKIDKRPFALRGAFNLTGGDKATYHSRKQTLLKALNAQAGTRINARPTPVQLKYTGAADDKIIRCFYEGGLEDEPLEGEGFAQQNISLRFVAFDPFFYADSESSVVLDPQDSANVYTVAAKIDGLWDDLGPPNAAGTYASVLAVASDSTYIYIGGDFLNWNNIAAADYIVRMNKSTGAYSALGSGLNGLVRGLKIDASGLLYVIGTFTNAGGVAAADYIATWNGTAWAAVGTPSTGATVTSVHAVDIDNAGNVYVAGNFLNLAGVAAADGIAMWNGTAWAALGTGVAGAGAACNDVLAITPTRVYAAGGGITSFGGVANTANLAMWNGSSWVEVGGGLTGTATCLAISSAGDLYVGGAMTAAGSVTVNRIAVWNGASWADLGGSSLNNTVWNLTFASNGSLYASGQFTAIGEGVLTNDGLAVWNGSLWVREDMNVPGTSSTYVVYFDGADLYIGFDTTGAAGFAGDTTIAYAGTAVAYPYVTINRSGGTSATIYRLTNATTGAEIYLSYSLLDGETLTLDFRPYSETALAAVSSFFGPVPGAILGGSNLGDFYLTPGRSGASQNNIIALYVGNQGGTPTITATMYYTAAYLSQD
jgi:hypothetical protein